MHATAALTAQLTLSTGVNTPARWPPTLCLMCCSVGKPQKYRAERSMALRTRLGGTCQASMGMCSFLNTQPAPGFRLPRAQVGIRCVGVDLPDVAVHDVREDLR